MVTEQDNSARLTAVETRLAEHTVALQDIRSELSELRQDVRSINERFDQMSARFDQRFDQMYAQINRIFLSTWAIGGAIIAALVALLLRGG